MARVLSTYLIGALAVMTGLSLLSTGVSIVPNTIGAQAQQEIQSQSSTTLYELEAVGPENAANLGSWRSMPSQDLPDTERNEVIAAALDHDGVKEWSDEWEFVNMDFGGTTEPVPRWTTAVVDLHLSPDAETAVACDTGWWARVEVDLLTKEVLSADYPTADDKSCHGELRMQGPIDAIEEQPSESSALLQAILPTAEAQTPGTFIAMAQQTDVITYDIYGSAVSIKTPTISSTIYSNMDQAVGHLLTQYFTGHVNNFVQGGWIATTVIGAPGSGVPADSKKIVYIDREMYGDYEARAVPGAGFNWVNGQTLDVFIVCNTSDYMIYFDYGGNVYSHNTDISCNETLRFDTINNGVWFENLNEDVDNWADYIDSAVRASSAGEFRDSDSNWVTWLNSNNVDKDCTGDTNPSAVITTGNVKLGGTANWDHLVHADPAC